MSVEFIRVRIQMLRFSNGMRFLTVFGMTDTVSGRWRGEMAGVARHFPSPITKAHFQCERGEES
jgi:hypothetical protein